MFEKQRLGEEIKKFRKKKKLTQKQLAFNICHQSEISRIEAGDFFPTIDTLYLIANRLQIPITYFFEVLAHKEFENAKVIKNKINNLSSSKNHQELHHYIESLLRVKNSHHPETEKYLYWQKFVAEYYLKKISADFCLTELFLLLRRKTLGMDVLLDLQIKNSIANILAENKNYEKSMQIYQEILNETSKFKEIDKLKTKVYYNFGKLLFLKKEFETAFILTEKGIVLSIELADMSLIGQLYYQLGIVMEELSFPFEEIAFTYQKSHFFLNTLGLEMYLKILNEKKGDFL